MIKALVTNAHTIQVLFRGIPEKYIQLLPQGRVFPSGQDFNGCYDYIPDKSNLRNDGVILAYSLKGYIPSWLESY